MTGWELFTTPWEFHLPVVVGSVALFGAYAAAIHFRVSWKAFTFFLGVLIMFLTLVSPLDALSDDYLFSAHMFQHILLDMICPILFILGLPASLVRRWFRWSAADRAERILSYPSLAWAIGVLTLWVWHLPILYDAALEHEKVHVFQHLTFLVTGSIMWWPVFNPVDERRMAPMASVVYLTLAMLADGLLAIILTLSSTAFYWPYARPDDRSAAMTLIREKWGLDQVSDQKLGGAIMWVFGNLIFLTGIMIMVVRWYNEPGAEETPGGGEDE